MLSVYPIRGTSSSPCLLLLSLSLSSYTSKVVSSICTRDLTILLLPLFVIKGGEGNSYLIGN